MILRYFLTVALLFTAAGGVSACSSTPAATTESAEVTAIRAYADPATRTTLEGLSENNLAKYTQNSNAQFKSALTQDILDKNGLERAYPHILAALAGKRCDFENRLITRDGTEHTIQTIYTPYYQNNAIEGIITLVIDITERKRMDESIIRSETEHRVTINALPEWIYVVDEHLCLIMLNLPLKSVFKKHGFTGDCVGMKVSSKLPFISPRSILGIKHVFRSGKTVITEEKFRLDDRTIYCEVWEIPIFNGEKVAKVICVMRDRSKEKEIESLKQKSAKEKEVLLREIHHRVKNNLAVINGLFDFSIRNTKNEELISMIQDLQLRIRSIALIHSHLYQSDRFDCLPLIDYVESLVKIIRSTFCKNCVDIETNLDPVDISIEKALPLGLVINELITNAIKYAFPDGKRGNILVSLKKMSKNQCKLSIKDNGIGIPPGFSLESATTMGFYIIRILTGQLEGKMKIERKGGTTFILLFRNK